MKKLLFILSLILLIGSAAINAQEKYVDSLFAKGNEAYRMQEYHSALDLYNAIVDTGFTSFELYFNLGNAYFKTGEYPKAILYYEKAKVLDGSNEDLSFNLQKANAYTIDKIEMIPEFFLVSWMQKFITIFPSNKWAIVALLAFAAGLASLLFYFINISRSRKVLFFSIGVIALLISILSYSFSVKTRNYIENSNSAIVMSSTVTVKGAPDINGVNVFIIHEGTKLRILRTIGDWYEIKLADGKQGWLLNTDVEKI